MKIRLVAKQANSPKIPFTRLGIDTVGAIVLGVLRDGEKNNGYSEGTSSVNLPRVEDITPADKAARVLNGVTFKTTLAGAIHKTNLAGTISV